MAADRDVLNAIRSGLEELAPALAALVARNVALAAENAELKGAALTDEQDDALAAQPALDLVNNLLGQLPTEEPPAEEPPAEPEA